MNGLVESMRCPGGEAGRDPLAREGTERAQLPPLLGDFHQVEVGLAALLGDEKEPLPVRMPGRVVVFPRMAGDPALRRAVGIHDVDLVCRLLLEKKSDPLAIAGPG